MKPDKWSQGTEWTEDEVKLVEEMQLRENQLRNLRKVLNSSIPRKKYEELSREVLPGYIIRDRNARDKAERIIKKKGWIRK